MLNLIVDTYGNNSISSMLYCGHSHVVQLVNLVKLAEVPP